MPICALDVGGKSPDLEPGCSGKSPNLPCLHVLICHPENGGDNSSAYLTGLWWRSNELTSLTRLEWSQVHRRHCLQVCSVGRVCNSFALVSQCLTHSRYLLNTPIQQTPDTSTEAKRKLTLTKAKSI